MKQLPEIKSVAKDNEDIIIQSSFEGTWLPSVSPLKIGDSNFSDCNNINYNKYGIVSIKGHVIFNVTPIATFTYGRAGHQLRVPNPLTGTKSYIIVQQLNDACTAGRLFINTNIPPLTGDYNPTAFLIESPGFSQGHFTESPGNQLVYSNGVQTLIYGGEEATISGFLLVDSITGLTPVNPINYTNAMMSASNAADNVVFIPAGKSYLIGATRPIQGFTPHIYTPNGTYSGEAQVQEWQGSGWSDVTSLVDGTYDWSRTHFKTGKISFASTIATCKPAYICEQLLYWYKVTLPAGSCYLTMVTIDMEIQPLVNLWDGVNRVCIQCEVYHTDHFEDYTPEVYDVSAASYPIAANISGLPTGTGKIRLMFTERTTAIRFAFPTGLVNKVANTYATIKYFNGTSYVSVGAVYDGTSNGNISMGQTGVMYWDAPAASSEVKKNEFGVIGYSYEISFSQTLTSSAGTAPYYTDGVFIDTIYGIPAPSTMGTYKFAFTYRNRLFLVGDVNGREGHAIDYSVTGTSDSFNGPDSSADGRRLYVGDGSSDLTCAVNVFNRYGAAMFDSEVLLKPHETYILDGESSSSDTSPFRINKISANVGCPAPATLCTAEVAFEVSKDAIRNIAIWLSAVGPMIFDASILSPISGIECYFDQFDSRCINYEYINRSHAWFDPSDYNWNLCMPVGYNIIMSGEIPGVTLINPHCAAGTYTLNYIA
jgi:hypothetical protein